MVSCGGGWGKGGYRQFFSLGSKYFIQVLGPNRTNGEGRFLYLFMENEIFRTQRKNCL